MIVFLDFEASSLGKRSFPVEVGWVREDGREESHLIRPAPDWTEWSAEAEAIHRLTRERLEREGEPHGEVARRMLAELSGHALYASAPSWDGQWLSRLLRAAGQPRHALRLRDTEDARRDAALAALTAAGVEPSRCDKLLAEILADIVREQREATPAHRALEDAKSELRLWQEARRRAEEAVRGVG
ncbi:transcriptional regulator [Muricoccus aerilatus]|uniref:3'-5' exonuclease n=1 Tax=Muricoccus aerilatus TaxID=452982 RepID=UPI0005C25E6C|nr:transcriptional regulator [Roseomonas aerilata]